MYMYMYIRIFYIHCKAFYTIAMSLSGPGCLDLAVWTSWLVQLIEHWSRNPVVVGLNPVRGISVLFHCLPWTYAFALHRAYIYVNIYLVRNIPQNIPHHSHYIHAIMCMCVHIACPGGGTCGG